MLFETAQLVLHHHNRKQYGRHAYNHSSKLTKRSNTRVLDCDVFEDLIGSEVPWQQKSVMGKVYSRGKVKVGCDQTATAPHVKTTTPLRWRQSGQVSANKPAHDKISAQLFWAHQRQKLLQLYCARYAQPGGLVWVRLQSRCQQ